MRRERGFEYVNLISIKEKVNIFNQTQFEFKQIISIIKYLCSCVYCECVCVCGNERRESKKS